MKFLNIAAPLVLLGGCMLAATILVEKDRPRFDAPERVVVRTVRSGV